MAGVIAPASRLRVKLNQPHVVRERHAITVRPTGAPMHLGPALSPPPYRLELSPRIEEGAGGQTQRKEVTTT